MTERFDETCWTIVRGAASGDDAARARFAAAYFDVIRAYLGARWRGGRMRERLEDAVQDVFLECFRDQGALARLDTERNVGFRTFLFGVVRNVARRHEERLGLAREVNSPSGFDVAAVPNDDESLARTFDRAWAMALLQRAGQRQQRWATRDGEAGERRLELLRLRFREGLPIREIAQRWEMDAAQLHTEFRKARGEFKRALYEEVRFHLPGSEQAVDMECLRLLKLLE